MENLYFVYITVSDKPEAMRIGEVLVSERWAACVNVLDPMTSMYWWKGAIQKDTETVLIAKTTESNVEGLIERVKALHSYDCPCVVAWPLEKGFAPYLKWIGDEVSD